MNLVLVLPINDFKEIDGIAEYIINSYIINSMMLYNLNM